MRTFKPRAAIGLALLTLLIAPGCGKDKKEDPPPTSSGGGCPGEGDVIITVVVRRNTDSASPAQAG